MSHLKSTRCVFSTVYNLAVGQNLGSLVDDTDACRSLELHSCFSGDNVSPSNHGRLWILMFDFFCALSSFLLHVPNTTWKRCSSNRKVLFACVAMYSTYGLLCVCLLKLSAAMRKRWAFKRCYCGEQTVLMVFQMHGIIEFIRVGLTDERK